MEERRTFVNWVKCPIEFSKKFEYVKFNTDYRIYKYEGFDRVYKERHHTKETVVLSFRQVFLDEENKLTVGYIQPFHPGWYDKATHLTEVEVIDYLMKEKTQSNKPKERESKGWFTKWLK